MLKKRLSIGVMTLALTCGIGTVPAQALMLAHPAASDDATSRSITHFSGGCTGTLIDSEWVLTADHCLKEIEKTGRVYIGPDMGAQEALKVESVHPTPLNEYRQKTYDVGLVKLAEPAQTIPAKLYQGNDKLPLGTKTQAYGWGNLAGYWEDKIPTQSSTIVEEKYNSSKNYHFEGVNAKLDGDSKHVWGDSGSPLFTENGELYGILTGGSLRNENIEDGTTAVYSPITDLHDWINNTTGKNFFDGSHNDEVNKSLEGVQYAFKQVDSFDNHRDTEIEAIQKFLNNEITLEQIGAATAGSLVPKIFGNKYVNPIVGGTTNPGNSDDQLTEEEKQQIEENIRNHTGEENIDPKSKDTKTTSKKSSSRNNDKSSSRDKDDDSNVEDTNINSEDNTNSNDSVNDISNTPNGIVSSPGNTITGNNVSGNAVNGNTVNPNNTNSNGFVSVDKNGNYHTVNGGVSSSVDSEEVSEASDGVKADTGSPTISILNKIRTIF